METKKFEDLNIPSWGYLLIAIGAYLGSNALAILISLIIKATVSTDLISQYSTVLSVGIQCFSYVVVVLILIVIFRNHLGDFLKRVFEKNTWVWVGIGFAVLWGGNYLYSYVLTTLKIESSSANQESLIEMTKQAPLLSGLYICLLAPVVEEIIFRLGLFRSLEKKNQWLALIVTSLLFAFMHMIASIEEGTLLTDLISLPSYLIGAFGLTYTYMKSKSLSSSILVHIINNTLSFVAIILLSSMAG